MKLNLAIISLSKDFCRVQESFLTHYNSNIPNKTTLMSKLRMVPTAHPTHLFQNLRLFINFKNPVIVVWSCIAKQGAKVHNVKSYRVIYNFGACRSCTSNPLLKRRLDNLSETHFSLSSFLFSLCGTL